MLKLRKNTVLMMRKTDRFKRFLLDGGFSFGDEYVPPVWAIKDRYDDHSPILYLEFRDDQKDVCDALCDWLNAQEDKINSLKKEILSLKYPRSPKWGHYEPYKCEPSSLSSVRKALDAERHYHENCSDTPKDFSPEAVNRRFNRNLKRFRNK